MNHLANITKKELKELLTPGTIVSIIMVVILFSCLGTMMSGQSEDVAAPKEIGIVYGGELDTELTHYTPMGGDTISVTPRWLITNAYSSTYGVTDPTAIANHLHFMTAAYGQDQAILDEMRSNNYEYVLSIPTDLKANFDASKQTTISTYFIYKQGGLFSSVSSSTGTLMVDSMSTLLTYAIEASSDPATAVFATKPITSDIDSSYTEVAGQVRQGVTPYQIYSSMMGQTLIVPIIVMIVIIMVGSVVISSMGSEKENKTLETLLTMPIRRTTIVGGKLLAAAIMGLVYGVCYMGGMMMYSKGLTSGLTDSSVDLAQYGLVMDTFDWIILLVVLFLAIFSALGICMILGAFTKNYKMAQTMTLPISGLAIIPMFVFMFSSWESLGTVGQALMFLIPFSHPMMAMDNLIFGDMSIVLFGIAYLVVFDIIMILITVRIYNSDILITGLGQNKTVVRIQRIFTKRGEHEDE
jgi:ABC-2 type transport system permease protein